MARPRNEGHEAFVRWVGERSQAEVAALLGIGQQTVSGYLAGRFRPGALLRLKLRDVAGIAPESWLTMKERARLSGHAA